MISYLSLGSNLGNRESILSRAVECLGERAGSVLRRSTLFYSPAWGFESEHEFCNLCVAIDTPLSPEDLLHVTQSIERELGRTCKSLHGVYHDRTIDIDILTYGDLSLATPTLTIPHPLMWERDFVRIPLQEIME